MSKTYRRYPAGFRFGSRTVVKLVARPDGKRQDYYLVRCDCGLESRVPSYTIKSARRGRCRNCARAKRYRRLQIGDVIGTRKVVGLAGNGRYRATCTCGRTTVKVRTTLERSECSCSRLISGSFHGVTMFANELAAMLGVSGDTARRTLTKSTARGRR